MDSWSRRYIQHLLVPVIVMVGVAFPLRAQPLDLSKAEFAVPVSDRSISGILTFLDDEEAVFEIREGSMLSVRFDGGRGYGLVPLIEESGAVDFAVYELLEVDAGVKVVELGAFSIQVGERRLAPESIPFDVTLSGVGQRTFSVPPLPGPGAYPAGDLRRTYALADTCCIYCDGRRICGCLVTTGCGSCCAQSCCGGDDGGPLNKVP